VPKYNQVKSSKNTRDKTRSRKTYTRKPVPYILPFLENPPLKKDREKKEKIQGKI
jgi:hypothetical protein